MRRKAVKTRTIEELSGWSTKRLLGRLRSLQRLEISAEQSDMRCEEAEDGAQVGLVLRMIRDGLMLLLNRAIFSH